MNPDEVQAGQLSDAEQAGQSCETEQSSEAVQPGLFPAGTKEGGPTTVICGLPGCVMYAKRTIFDLLLPRIMADDPISAEEIYALGEGGLCLGCETCTWPNCGFGKGRMI